MKLRIYLLTLPLILLMAPSCKALSKDPVDQFWNWFKANEAKYKDEKINETLYDELGIQLHKIDSNLTFEFSPVHGNGVRELTISADGIKASFPAVRSVVSKAPKIDKWQFNAFRQRIPGDSMNINFNGLKISYQDLYFRYKEDSENINIELNVRNYDLSNTSDYKAAIYILLDGLIGEYDMETQIGGIDFTLLDENKMNILYPIIKLRDVVDARQKRNKPSSLH